MKKYLVDTCGWIEWLNNGKLASSFEPFFKHLNHLVVPTLVQYELYKWACREKNEATALEIIGVTEQALAVPLDTHIALCAADFSKQYKLAMGDAVIYASAKKNEAELITSDQHFAHISDITFFKKSNHS